MIDNRKLWFDDYCVASEDRLHSFMSLIRCNPDYTVELIGTEGLGFDVPMLPPKRNQMEGIIIRKNRTVDYGSIKERIPYDCDYLNEPSKNRAIKLIQEGGNIGDILDDYKNGEILLDDEPVELDMVYEDYLCETLESFYNRYNVDDWSHKYKLDYLVKIEPDRYPYGYYDIATTLLLGCHYGMIGEFIYRSFEVKSVREFYLTSPYVHETSGIVSTGIVSSNKIKQLVDYIYVFKTKPVFVPSNTRFSSDVMTLQIPMEYGAFQMLPELEP
jgi:hypothetical protein